MSDAVTEIPVKTKSKKSPRPEGQTTGQLFDFAANIGRDIAKKLAESPKVVMSAALMGFNELPAETQIALITSAKVKRLSK